MWLFDTVALSESRKPRVNEGFGHWLNGVDDRDVHTSVLCLGEVRRGVVKLGPGAKRDLFGRWLDVGLPNWLGPRILPIDSRVARIWGNLGMRGRVEPIDALIGATAVAANLTVVTRNTRHFGDLKVRILNPWT